MGGGKIDSTREKLTSCVMCSTLEEGNSIVMNYGTMRDRSRVVAYDKGDGIQRERVGRVN